MDTLFFALYPPSALARRATELAERLRFDLGLRARPTDAVRLHVTLHFLGPVANDIEIVERASRAADVVRAAPFDLRRDPMEVPEQSIAPFEWTVRDFVLIRSLVGQGRHMVLGRWPLEQQ